MVALVRDTYRPADPVDELTDSERFASPEAVENHLLDRVLRAAYARRPGQLIPRFAEEDARRWLGHLARRMNAEGTRELAWWQIPRWVPAWPRVFATVLACLFVAGFVTGSGVELAGLLVSALGLPLTIGLPDGFIGTVVTKLGLALTIGLVIGSMAAFGEEPPRWLNALKRRRDGVGRNLATGLLCGLGCGVAGGLVNGLVTGLVAGLVFGLLTGLVAGSVVGLVGTFGYRPPRHLTRPRWRRADVPVNLGVGLAVGIVTGLMYGIMARQGLPNGSGNGVGKGLGAGVLVWLFVSTAIGVMTGLGRPSTRAMSPVDARSSWQRNRQFGIAVGMVFGSLYTLMQSFAVGLVSQVPSRIVAGLALGMAVALLFPATWQVTLAGVQLWRRGAAPIRFLHFLEDARDRQVLRTVGQMYQFRHAKLQDFLAHVDERPLR